MRLTDMVAQVKSEQRDEKQARLARHRTMILKDLRRGLNEEEYQALAAELKPRVEGYALAWNGREVILSREGFMERNYTEAKYRAGGTLSVSFEKRIKSGRDLLEFLAGVQ